MGSTTVRAHMFLPAFILLLDNICKTVSWNFWFLPVQQCPELPSSTGPDKIISGLKTTQNYKSLYCQKLKWTCDTALVVASRMHYPHKLCLHCQVSTLEKFIVAKLSFACICSCAVNGERHTWCTQSTFPPGGTKVESVHWSDISNAPLVGMRFFQPLTLYTDADHAWDGHLARISLLVKIHSGHIA